MNFLAHHAIAMHSLTPADPLPMYVVGSVLPDLLPLADAHLRPALINHESDDGLEDAALRRGVRVHLATDAAFHKTAAFAGAQAEVGHILAQTPFEGIRVRRFFVAHVLVELALDAVLLRDTPSLADEFYEAFDAADYAHITRWTEGILGQPLPKLPLVLTRFAESRYLRQYEQDEGVATGLSRLCARARQDTFEGENYARLVAVVKQAVEAVEGRAEALLAETGAALSLTSEPIAVSGQKSRVVK